MGATASGAFHPFLSRVGKSAWGRLHPFGATSVNDRCLRDPAVHSSVLGQRNAHHRGRLAAVARLVAVQRSPHGRIQHVTRPLPPLRLANQLGGTAAFQRCPGTAKVRPERTSRLLGRPNKLLRRRCHGASSRFASPALRRIRRLAALEVRGPRQGSFRIEESAATSPLRPELR